MSQEKKVVSINDVSKSFANVTIDNQTELSILKKLSRKEHPNIFKFYGHVEENDIYPGSPLARDYSRCFLSTELNVLI